MTDLSRGFRRQLSERARVSGLTEVLRTRSSDGKAVKSLFALADGLRGGARADGRGPLLCYSDGLLDALDGPGLGGEQSVASALAGTAHLAVDGQVAELLRLALAGPRPVEEADDITVMGVELTSSSDRNGPVSCDMLPHWT